MTGLGWFCDVFGRQERMLFRICWSSTSPSLPSESFSCYVFSVFGRLTILYSSVDIVITSTRNHHQFAIRCSFTGEACLCCHIMITSWPPCCLFLKQTIGLAVIQQEDSLWLLQWEDINRPTMYFKTCDTLFFSDSIELGCWLTRH